MRKVGGHRWLELSLPRVKKTTVEYVRKHFSQILAQVEAGEEITIIRSGVPVARLVPMDEPKKRRELGLHRDSIWIADDFDAPLPAEILDSFEGKKPKGEDQGKGTGPGCLIAEH